MAITDNERELLYRLLSTMQQQIEHAAAASIQQREISKQSEQKLEVVRKERNIVFSELLRVQEQLEQSYIALSAEQQNSKHALLAAEQRFAEDIESLEVELRELKVKYAREKNNYLLLQQELIEIKNSTTWRATAPIRALGVRLKRANKAREKLQRERALIIASGYFDIEWYLEQNPDVSNSGIDPVEHYLLFGADEGRSPGPLFDGKWYKQYYPDVAAAEGNPLLHFILFGKEEGRSGSPKLLSPDN